MAINCIICGLNFNQKEELAGHFEAFHTSDIMVSSNTMTINAENLISLPEIVQDEKALILPNFASECDAS
jgi:hypothetical protein